MGKFGSSPVAVAEPAGLLAAPLFEGEDDGVPVLDAGDAGVG
jgi:hypothetical protein